MRPVIDILEEKISAAMAAVTGQANCGAVVRQSTDPRFGDYQANGIMPLAKQLKTNPRKLAEEVVKKVNLADICQPLEIAGPGFINLRLKPDFIGQMLLEINSDLDRLGIDKVNNPKTMVVDFSGPNIAKQMHVGHLRSTIIGDCICRMLKFQGHKVIRQNHIGDWGTQFGMLIAYLRKENPEVLENPDSAAIEDLEQFYRNAKMACDNDSQFADEARKEVINLHTGNENTLKIWRHIVDESRRHYQPIYDCLGVNLHKDNERGESFYKDKLAGVVGDLKKQGLAVESDGAICVFPPGFKDKDDKPLPFIIRKSDVPSFTPPPI